MKRYYLNCPNECQSILEEEEHLDGEWCEAEEVAKLEQRLREAEESSDGYQDKLNYAEDQQDIALAVLTCLLDEAAQIIDGEWPGKVQEDNEVFKAAVDLLKKLG